MKLNWSFWILKCVFLPLPGKNTGRMDDPRSDSPHREECTLLVTLSFLKLAQRRRGEVHDVSSQAVYLIPFDLKYSVLTSTLLPIQSSFTEADTKEGTT